jgi:threonine aldolase
MVMELKVDLFSDTGTRPSIEMREFMSRAEVGDEQLMEDPSVNRLNEMVTELLGKEDAIYLPSGLMSNQISFAVHCQAGDEIIMDRTAHPIHYEAGATSLISRASIKPLNGKRGIFTADDLENVINLDNIHSPRTKLVSIEQTTNLGGGAIWPLDRIKEVCRVARNYGIAIHMDGARLMNAVVASGISAKEYAEGFDSVWIDLSKGLGAPIGSVLAGSREFIQKASYWKQRLGGAMRQAGIIAAGGIYALEHNIERLEEDNENARFFAKGIDNIPGIKINPDEIDTNIVLFTLESLTAEEFSEKLLERGVRLSIMGRNLMRAVTHLDLNREDIIYAVKVIKDIMNEI